MERCEVGMRVRWKVVGGQPSNKLPTPEPGKNLRHYFHMKFEACLNHNIGYFVLTVFEAK